MKRRFEPIDLKSVRTYPLASRRNLVKKEDFATTPLKTTSITDFLTSLPDILAGKAFKELVKATGQAFKKGKPVIWAMGAHPIKVGLNPVLINLMKKGLISLLALNGAGIVHDVEIALVGETSEDVQEGLIDGSFGFAKETGELINEAVKEGAKKDLGFGESVSQRLLAAKTSHQEVSLLYNAAKLGVPVTVHVALGTDIVHTHPCADGGAIGEASLLDFRILASAVKELNNGGVYFNIGSAVLLPEVFLKALTLVRNLGYEVENFTTANFDFKEHYRPLQNVVKRPTAKPGSRGFSFIGHHEIMIPLLAQALLEEMCRGV
jgi:hypothetical protein